MKLLKPLWMATLLGLNTAASATVLEGARLFAIDGAQNVVATFVDGGGAGFTNTAFLVTPVPEIGPFFNNHTSVAGDTVFLGSFTAGTELVFAINVDSGTTTRYFSGAASTNPDNVVHARIDDAFGLDAHGNNSILVSFEDQFGGGDLNYRDMVFTLSNVRAEPAVVPLPAPLVLLASGIVALWSRRVTRTAQ